VSGTAGCGDGDLATGEAGAGGDEFCPGREIRGLAVDILAGGYGGAGGQSEGVAVALSIFVGHDDVGSVGHDGSSGDFDGLPGSGEGLRHHAGGLESDDAEGAGWVLRKVSGVESEPVHGDAIKSGQVAVGVDRSSQNPAVGGTQPAIFDGEGGEVLRDDRGSFGGRKEHEEGAKKT